jgi:GGDEF domain-containing protein
MEPNTAAPAGWGDLLPLGAAHRRVPRAAALPVLDAVLPLAGALALLLVDVVDRSARQAPVLAADALALLAAGLLTALAVAAARATPVPTAATLPEQRLPWAVRTVRSGGALLLGGGLMLLALAGATGLAATHQPGRIAVPLLVLLLVGALVEPVRLAAAAGGVCVGAAVAALVPGSPAAARAEVPAVVLAVLAAAVVHVRTGRRLRELRAARASLEAARVRDPLTGVVNRKGLLMLGGPMLETARRSGDALHCLVLDVGGLAAVNDAAGHEAGDELLLAVAEALAGSVRGTDVVARWRGDAFCVIGPGPGVPPLELERRVLERVAAMPGGGVAPRLCAGSAILAPWDSGDLASLLDAAERETGIRRELRKRTAPDGVLPRRAAAGEA